MSQELCQSHLCSSHLLGHQIIFEQPPADNQESHGSLKFWLEIHAMINYCTILNIGLFFWSLDSLASPSNLQSYAKFIRNYISYYLHHPKYY